MARANSRILPRSTCIVTGSPFWLMKLLSIGMASPVSLGITNRPRSYPKRQRRPERAILWGERHSSEKGTDMITKFDSLYAGHVDMDDIGYGGDALRRPPFPHTP